MTGIINWKGSGSKESQNSFKILSQLLMDATSKKGYMAGCQKLELNLYCCIIVCDIFSKLACFYSLNTFNYNKCCSFKNTITSNFNCSTLFVCTVLFIANLTLYIVIFNTEILY